ncbi:MAG: YceI family protein [Burkholderiaceae bacterium]
MMKSTRAAWLAALILAAGAAPAQSGPTLVPNQSEIVFTSTQMGVPVEGRFQRFDAHFELDPARAQIRGVRFSVDTGSATLGLAEADAELRKPDWFNVAAYDKAVFQSTDVKRLGDGRFSVTGRLNLKGRERDLVVPVRVTQAGATSIVTGSLTLRRLDHRVGDAEWSDTSLVANDVQVRFKLALTGLPPL